jgi:hypothetical protein
MGKRSHLVDAVVLQEACGMFGVLPIEVFSHTAATAAGGG